MEYRATFDCTEVTVRPYRGQQTVIITCPTTSSELGTIPLRGNRVRQLVEHGFQPVSSSGKADFQHTGWEMTSTSHGLILQRQGAPLALIPTPDPLSSIPVACQHVPFLLSKKSPREYRNVGDLLRGDDNVVLCSLATTRLMAPTHAGTRRYVFVGQDGLLTRRVPPAASVLIDQSVLIDVERAARGRSDLSEELRDHLAWLQRLDTIPGFGFAEAAGLTADQRRRAVSLERSWAAAMEWDLLDEAELRQTVEAEADEPSVDRFWAQRSQESGLGLAAMNYAALLTAAPLWAELQGRKFVQSQRLEAFASWADAVNNEVMGNPGHVGSAIRRLLLGKGAISQQAALLLKLHRPAPYKLSELRGAAEDGLYLTATDMLQAGAIGDQPVSEIFFMTADRPLAQARSHALAIRPPVPGSPLGGVLRMDLSYWQYYSPENCRQLGEIEAALWRGAVARNSSARTVSRQRLLAKIRQLERELGQQGILRA